MHVITSFLFLGYFLLDACGQNFQWSPPNSDTRPWPQGSGQPIQQPPQQPPPQAGPSGAVPPWQLNPNQNPSWGQNPSVSNPMGPGPVAPGPAGSQNSGQQQIPSWNQPAGAVGSNPQNLPPWQQPQWSNDPNRPVAQPGQGQPFMPPNNPGPGAQTSADRAIMGGSSNPNPQWNQGGWSGPAQQNFPGQSPNWNSNQPGSFGQQGQPNFQPGPGQGQPVGNPWQQPQPQPQPGQPFQQGQPFQPGQPMPGQSSQSWPGQQGWIGGIQQPPSSTFIPGPVTSSTSDDESEEILKDILAAHLRGTFPQDEVRQYNAKIPVPRQSRNYWVGERYYNLDPDSQLRGKEKCTFRLPPVMSNLHYDDRSPVSVMVFQCVQGQERCCGMDCCNLNSPNNYQTGYGGNYANGAPGFSILSVLTMHLSVLLAFIIAKCIY